MTSSSTLHDRPARRDSAEPAFSTRALHVAVFAVFAISLPVLDLIGRQAEFLVAHRAGRFEIAALTLVFFVLVPAVPIAVMKIWEHVFPRLGNAFYRAALAILATVIALPAIKKVGEVSLWMILTIAISLGVLVALLLRFAAFRSFLSLLVAIFLIAPINFVFVSPASKLLLNSEAPVHAGSVGNPVPLVVLVFDEFSLPDLLDETLDIDANLYPNFSALANSSYWFKRGTTVAQSTRYAVPAILTGKFPDQTRLPLYTDYPENLFTVLGNEYSIYTSEPLTNLCPDVICRQEQRLSVRWRPVLRILLDLRFVYMHIVLPDEWASKLPPITQMWKDFGRNQWWDDKRATKALEFLEKIPTDSTKPPAIFLHTILPHVPWEYLPSGKVYGDDTGFLLFNPGVRKGGAWGGDRWLINECYQRYLLQLRYTDHLLGQFFDILKRKGVYDEALVVVVADHGVSFLPNLHRRQASGKNLYEIASVPFFVKMPGQTQGAAIEKSTETIDILPTIASVLEVESLPGSLPGQSIVDPGFEERAKKVIFRSAGQVGRALSFDAGSWEEDVAKYVNRRIRLFGPGSDPEAIYGRGPCPELVGRPSRDLEAEELDVWLHGSQKYDGLDLQGESIPARVFGRIPEGEATAKLLAIGVNGVVRALARPFAYDKGPLAFSAMIPESSLVAGSNRIQVYDVSKCLPERPPYTSSEEIFSSGFESGNLEPWDLAVELE